jgi:hypothetical protein
MFCKREIHSNFLNWIWKLIKWHIFREESFRNSVSRGVAGGIKSDMNLVLISVAGWRRWYPYWNDGDINSIVICKFLDSWISLTKHQCLSAFSQIKNWKSVPGKVSDFSVIHTVKSGHEDHPSSWSVHSSGSLTWNCKLILNDALKCFVRERDLRSCPLGCATLLQHLKGLWRQSCEVSRTIHVLCNLDDVIVIGRTFQEHLTNRWKVFQRIREARLKLNVEKCQLFQEEVRYLISPGGLTTDPEKLKAVKEWPTPKNKHDIRSFLGLCTYYKIGRAHVWTPVTW